MKKKKKNKIVTVLVVILVMLLCALAAILGYLYYRENHIFVEDKAYSIHSEMLDLREENISFDHYNAVHSQLPNCEILWNVPFQGSRYSNDIESLSISSLTQEDIDLMRVYFPRLKKINASACSDYVMLESLKAQLPELDVSYRVSLGKAEAEPDAEFLTLVPEDYKYDTLMKNLAFLPKVSSVLLKTPELTLEQIDALKEAYPNIDFSCTIKILGEEYETGAKDLNLSSLMPEQVDSVCERLSMLPALENIELMNDQGSTTLTREDARKIMQAAPTAQVHYTFEYFGQTLSSTETEEVKLNNKKIGESGMDELRLTLDLLPNCKRFVLEYCGIPCETMAKLREDYRGRTKIVWRINFANGTTLTDADVIRSTYDLVDDNSHDLIYCEDVRFVDFGHDEYLDGIEFISGMVNLEYCIISGAPIKDLTPFANCKKLKVLELANCTYITDISPLAQCENLEMLNISFAKISDLSPLDNLNLTHLSAMGLYRPMISAEEQARFKEAHPDCRTMFGTGDLAYGRGWRYDDNDKAMPWYELITAAFRYPKAPNNVGWYFQEEES